jgi:hypothetical protein
MANHVFVWLPNNRCIRCGEEIKTGDPFRVLGMVDRGFDTDHWGVETKDMAVWCLGCWQKSGLEAVVNIQLKKHAGNRV